MIAATMTSHFSFRTPLYFTALFLTALNCPPFLLRLVEVFVSGFLSCVRFFTAPLRALSPVGLSLPCVPPIHLQHSDSLNVPTAELSQRLQVVKTQTKEEIMGFGRGALLWMLGIPLPIVLLLALFWHH
jgi:hypothetical protein